MLTLTPEQFKAKIDRGIVNMQRLTDRQLPVVIGKAAVDHFKESFDNQGWERKPWKEVNRRTPGTKAYNYNSRKHPTRLTRGILIGDHGNLKRSIQYDPQPSKVEITSDLPYARVHNKGLMAGRKGSEFKMPKRQFIGRDKELDQIVKKEISSAMKQIL